VKSENEERRCRKKIKREGGKCGMVPEFLKSRALTCGCTRKQGCLLAMEQEDLGLKIVMVFSLV